MVADAGPAVFKTVCGLRKPKVADTLGNCAALVSALISLDQRPVARPLYMCRG